MPVTHDSTSHLVGSPYEDKSYVDQKLERRPSPMVQCEKCLVVVVVVVVPINEDIIIH